MKKEMTRTITVMIGENIMDYNNIYNFKNPIRHFINIDNLIFPTSPASIDIDDMNITMR